MKRIPGWMWAVVLVWHYVWFRHWPDFVLVHTQLECLNCDRKPPSRGLRISPSPI